MSQKFSSEFTDAEILLDEPMKAHTSFGVGGKADYFATVKSLFGLNQLITECKKKKIKYKIIGNGTNLLVSDAGYRGCIISTVKLNGVFYKLDKVKAMCGAPLSKLINFATENSLCGLESLSGIPATLGGAVAMNAGAFGVKISDYITTVETVKDGKFYRYDKNECQFSYRQSRFLGKNEAIVSATFDLYSCDRKSIKSNVKRVLDIRSKLQPSGKSCGSTFKNLKGVSAGQIIEGAGLKGLSVGGASVSDKHANFIINNGSATADDIFQLVNKIKIKVKELYGVSLVEEMEYIGEF